MSRHSIRHLLELAVGVLAAVLVVETWLAMGLVVPVAVSGSSMAPTLRGPHRVFHCPDCRGDFSVGIDEESEDARAFCPACGSRRAVLADKEPQPGDRLVINRTAFAWRGPRRWEVVVFRSPQGASELGVKRVVGLPGERVSLAGGDVLVDGRLVHKSLAEQRALGQLVYRQADKSVELQSLDSPAWQIELVPIRDFMLTSQVRLATDAALRMAIDNELGRLEMTFDAVADEIRVLQDGHLLAESKVSTFEVPIGTYCEWTFSLFDGQALVAVDGHAQLTVSLAADEGTNLLAMTRPQQRSAAAIYGANSTMAEPAVWRDAYYEYRYGDRRTERPPGETQASSPDPAAAPIWQLGPREYFVLGDHAEISDDSRSWLAGPGLDGKLLIGKPLGTR